jgi:hypothetical protein
VQRFDSRVDLEASWREVLALARTRLVLFDPDFKWFPLGASDVDATLRAFLRGGGLLRLALHDSAHVERHYPRFLRLLRDYGHLIECRQTPRNLHHLTDSFTVADQRHVLRRFHSDHLRGETAFDTSEAVELPMHRFHMFWEASRPALGAQVTGL